MAFADFTSFLIGSNLYHSLQIGIFDLFALINLLYATILFVFNCGCFFRQENKQFKDNLANYLHNDNFEGNVNMESLVEAYEEEK